MKALLPVLIFLIVIVFVGVLEATNTTHFLHRKTAIATKSGSQSTKGEPVGNNTRTNVSADTSANDSSQAGDNKSNSSTPSAAMLLTPSSGSLVSNHHPSLSGSSDQKTISSVCTTTPGASCIINFTKDGITKSLPAEITDRGGSAYWTWNVQDLLSTGSWAVTAVSTLSGQTKSATDALQLVVSP